MCDDPGPGVPRKITDADVERVIVKTLGETPENATHWSTRSMAAAAGMSRSAVSRIRRPFAPAPHRAQTPLLSTDPLFIGKARDVDGSTSTRRTRHWCSAWRRSRRVRSRRPARDRPRRA
ncbi:hypothetical protein [Streptomyces roseolus]|uniref:hypothetical protein n=1 Tax=Streptomyces roseolus TaxID=67358 RepID=UPI001E55B995|nr:hypothetical protein [Streptomyces roseolus]